MFVLIGLIIIGIGVIVTIISTIKGKVSRRWLKSNLVLNVLLLVLIFGTLLARERGRYEFKDFDLVCQASHQGSVFGWTYSDGEESKDFLPFGPLDCSETEVLRSADVEAEPHLIAGGSIVCQALSYDDTVVGWFEKGSDRRMVPYLLPCMFFRGGKDGKLTFSKGEAKLQISCLDNGFGKGKRYQIEIKSVR